MMEYLIDSADLEAIRKLNDCYPIAGVTTNPLIISRCNIKLSDAISGIREIIGGKMLHVQVISEECGAIVKEAEKIVARAGDNTYIKVPVTENGIKAMKILHSAGYKITATAIFTPQQALIAACAGANYVAPYVNRLDNISTNGVEIAGNINILLDKEKMPCKVLAASFSNVEQIHMTTMHGVSSLTIAPALFYKLIYHPLTDNAVTEFIREGSKFYDI